MWFFGEYCSGGVSKPLPSKEGDLWKGVIIVNNLISLASVKR